MKQVAKGEGFTAINIGELERVGEYSLIHPKLKTEIFGKLFLKDITESTGTEISFNLLPPHTEVPYFHRHADNEETYIILKGTGDFQIDDNCFPISEGSVIRVAPAPSRGMRNSLDEPMIYMVIQSKENSLGNYSTEDGTRTEWKPLWK
jgi:mannose-6-phosphate isomerase-like protein (cupin superfamily)